MHTWIIEYGRKKYEAIPKSELRSGYFIFQIIYIKNLLGIFHSNKMFQAPDLQERSAKAIKRRNRKQVNRIT